MILPSDKEYIQTKKIILGQKSIKSEFVSLAKWINETYNVKTVNIYYDEIKNQVNEIIPRIQIIFEFKKEEEKFLTKDIFHFNKKMQNEIASKFSETIHNQGLSKNENLITKIFNTQKKEKKYLTKNVFVIFGSFEPIAKQETIYKITQEEITSLKESLYNSDIWEITFGFIYPTFFVFKNEQIEIYDKPKIKKEWAEKCFEIVRKHDEFSYFKLSDLNVFIDSKQNFDDNYQSNWFYYYK